MVKVCPTFSSPMSVETPFDQNCPSIVASVIGARRPSAVCCAVLTGLFASLVLSTFSKLNSVLVCAAVKSSGPPVPAVARPLMVAFAMCAALAFVTTLLSSVHVAPDADTVMWPLSPSLTPPFAKTNAVVAICVVLVPSAAVGAVGTPVSAGLASGALSARFAIVA